MHLFRATQPVASVEAMSMVMKEFYVKYLTEKMPPAEGGYDYSQWVEYVFTH